jgi:hypothetical protein
MIGGAMSSAPGLPHPAEIHAETVRSAMKRADISSWRCGSVWFGVRCVLSIVSAMPHQPMPRPATWWL